ncbi:MAG TPA: molybdenum cofactor biosynthesis protein MoaE [Saprospiraceae bacterium]|nr:molybdenum cofactor biosynthesis protein MoaE [Saprospiraceae bacterium]
MSVEVKLSNQPLEPGPCISFVRSENCGAEVLFIGTVRDQTRGKAVNKLFFEAYEPMAIKEMEKIGALCLRKYEISKMSFHHRLGELQIGEVPVILAVSAPHRVEAFKACAEAMDLLKQNVPIWKKEYFEDGEVWVAAHP